MNGVNQKNFGLCFTIWLDTPAMQSSPHPAEKTRCLPMMESSNTYQNRQIKYQRDQKVFPKVMRVRWVRIKVTWSQNSFYKSATTSRAWPRPLRGAFLIPPALLVVADFFKSKGGPQYLVSASIIRYKDYRFEIWTDFFIVLSSKSGKKHSVWLFSYNEKIAILS